MASPDALFQLIKSLTKSEKRFFKLSSSIHGGNKNYLKLFEVIDRMEEYDDESVRKKLSREKFIKNNFFKEKGNLYQLVLKSLNEYNNRKPDFEIKELLKSVAILEEKSLLDQASQLLTKVKKLALEYEWVQYMPEILLWEKRLMTGTYNLETKIKFAQSFRREGEEAIEAIQNLFAVSFIQNSVFSLVLEAQDMKNPAQGEELNNMVRALEDLEQQKLPFEGRKILFHAYQLCSIKKGDILKRCEYAEKGVQLLEAHPKHIKGNPFTYLAALGNLLTALSILSEAQPDPEVDEKFRKILSRLRRFPDSMKVSELNDYARMFIFKSSYPAELEFNISRGRLEAARKLVPEVEEGIRKFRNELPKPFLMVFYIILAKLFFKSGEYKKALLWLNRVINSDEIKPNVRYDLYSFAKIFNMMIHYELGNRDLLDYVVRSTYRFLYRANRLFKAETYILNFIRKYSYVQRPAERREAFRELRDQLLPLKDDAYEKSAFAPFDYIEWLDQKIEELSDSRK